MEAAGLCQHSRAGQSAMARYLNPLDWLDDCTPRLVGRYRPQRL